LSEVDEAQRSWRELTAEVEGELLDAGLDNAAHEARWLVQHAAGLNGAAWEAQLDGVAGSLPAAHVRRMLDRRTGGEPLQYVLASWTFRELDVFVDRRVLIPRAETEWVVQVALGESDRVLSPARTEGGQRPQRVVDLGTGSGVIGLSMAYERDWVEVWATDASPDAIDVARANLAGIGRAATRVTLCEGSWFDALPNNLRGTIDLIVSNPPYVSEAEHARLDPGVRAWEPHEALVPGPTGLEAIEQILRDAPAWLAPHGVVVLEIGETQADAATALSHEAGFTDVVVHPDLAGRPRTLVARRIS
jgi:release factor glutamine methyltransferase